jgi:3-hydroxyacyl-[acyl-carrier-protein] dehydratase
MATVSLQISPQHPAFPGHFPDMPIVPGAVLLDEALRALGFADGGRRIQCEIAAAKFHSAVRPGESLTLEHERSADGSVHFVIRTPDRTVASGRLNLVAALRSADRED